MGALDFTMTQLNNETWLKGFTPEQLAYFHSFPLWSLVVWGLGTWGSFLGSVLLLLRQRFAVPLFGVSLVGAVLTNLYSYGLSDGLKFMPNKTGAVIFSAVIFVIIVLLFIYAKNMRQRGVLR